MKLPDAPKTLAELLLSLSKVYTTSTAACPWGVLVSAPCLPGESCRFCPGLKRFRDRDARPVLER